MSLAPEPGSGKTRMESHVQERLGLLRGLSRFFERLTAPDGSLVCPRHRVEHTGKVIYAALINLTAWRYSREEEYLACAHRQVLRAVDHLGEDPESQVPVFLPGRVDHRNASTNAIDGGACADVIATLLEEVPSLFSDGERQRCQDALERHVEGYLRHAARERPITAQRLWAATGVARAARLLQRADWAADALAGCARALDELTPSGVAPYIPAGTSHCTHPGLADASSFYHSRTPGFVLFVHETLGVPLGDRARERIRQSLLALLAMRDGRGLKALENEAKAWYWESAYEVASHPFDVYALHVGARVLGEPDFAAEAGRAMEEWIQHIEPMDGGANSHHGRGVNFQCRIFWSGHAAWIARIIEDVPMRAAPRPSRDIDLGGDGLLHVERPRYVALARGACRASSNLFGCGLAGGALQSLVVRGERGARPLERLDRRRFRRRREGSFLLRARGRPGRLKNLLRVLREERGDLRFRLYVASIEWHSRGGRLRGLGYPLRHILLRSLAEASPWCASHLDRQATHSYDGRVAVFRGALADRWGERVPGTATERRLEFLDERVVLHDVLRLEGVSGRVAYLLPAALVDVQAQAEGATLRRRGRWLVLEVAGGPVELSVSGSLQ